VLLHGHPRTHTTWYRVAPLLVAAGHAVVCPDLRGYGRSSKPDTTRDHSPYSKREMAGDIRRLMHQLGHEHFAVVGHDRGSNVAMRLALDALTWSPTIMADPEAWYGADPDRMVAENHADHQRAIHDPATVRAMLEDYRAELGTDRGGG